jgi:hypothetical protein
MSEEIIPIVESYLEARRFKTKVTNSEYKQKLKLINISENKIDDIILKMDDEWTSEHLLRMKIKRSRANMFGGYIIGVLGIIITVLTFLGILFNGQIFIFFYGAIAAGIVTGILSQSSISSIKHELKMRKYKWKNWC